MQYTATYQSPVGEILLAVDDIGLTGLWFEGGKCYALSLDKEHEEREAPVLLEAKRWLDIYFKGKEPGFMPPVHMIGTQFQREVWEILRRIHHYPLPPCGRNKRKPDRICGRDRQEDKAPGP